MFVSTVLGFTARSQALDPRDVAAWLNGHFRVVGDAVTRCDGVIVKYVGDGLLAFFAGAEHRRRALEAARHARGTGDAALVMGLGAGPVLLATIGHPEHLATDLLGATVSLAFRVNGWATREGCSHLVADDSVLAGLEPPGDARRHPDVTLQGLGAPRVLWELGVG